MPLTWCCCLLLLGADVEPGIEVRAADNSAGVEIIAALPERVLSRLPAQLSADEGERWLRMTLLDAQTGKEGPPLLGKYEKRSGGLVFVPRFALSAGQTYRITLEIEPGRRVTRDHRVPEKAATTPTTVAKIYPTADVLPANLLKFYIHFSAPMRESRDIFDQIRLLDADGKPVGEPWRRAELWSADSKRLTLLIHPGRIKQGVNLREQEGPVLCPERAYTLAIGADVLDAEGQPLGQTFRKKFRTSAEEHRRPLPQEWKLQPPAAGTTQPLRLEFPRPLDRALLDKSLKVRDSTGHSVAGKSTIGSNEKSWSFQPEQPWRAADYAVHIDEGLEDLAGNTPARRFDVDLTASTGPAPRLTLSFRPRTP